MFAGHPVSVAAIGSFVARDVLCTSCRVAGGDGVGWGVWDAGLSDGLVEVVDGVDDVLFGGGDVAAAGDDV